MRFFRRTPVAPRLTGAVAFLAHLPEVMDDFEATRHFAELGGFAFTMALDDTFRALGRPGTFHAADNGSHVVYLADGMVLDHTGLSNAVIEEEVSRDRVARMAIGQAYARIETLERDRRWAARMIATAEQRAEAPEIIRSLAA